MRMSLLPRRSLGQSAKRVPRYPDSPSLSPWISVPMAPSSTRMLSPARRRSSVSAGDGGMSSIMRLLVSICRGRLARIERSEIRDQAYGLAPPVPDFAALNPGYKDPQRSCDFPQRPHPQQMTDRKHEIGAVHGVEMKIRDAAIDEVHHLFSRDCGGD